MLDAGEMSFSKGFFANPGEGLSIFKDCGGWFAEVSPNFAHDCSTPSLAGCSHGYIFICAYQCFSSAFLNQNVLH